MIIKKYFAKECKSIQHEFILLYRAMPGIFRNRWNSNHTDDYRSRFRKFDMTSDPFFFHVKCFSKCVGAILGYFPRKKVRTSHWTIGQSVFIANNNQQSACRIWSKEGLYVWLKLDRQEVGSGGCIVEIQ